MNQSEAAPLASAYALQTGEALSLGTSLSVLRDKDVFVYFVFTLPLASHACDDQLARNLQLARWARLGLAKQSVLAHAFGLAPRTMRRAKRRLEQAGEVGFVRQRQRRQRHGIVDPQLLQEAAARLQAGQSLYRVAQDLGVNVSTLWRYTQEGALPASQPGTVGRAAAALCTRSCGQRGRRADRPARSAGAGPVAP